IRSAAVLRKVAIKGPIGVNRLAQEFGGPRDRGVKPNAAASGSRKIIRTILQQLESKGLLESKKSPGGNVNLGKVISSKGQSYVDAIAHESRAEAESRYPGLANY
ncbi:MAG: 40S ribosomal protein S19, partial [Candidatus Thermoplasmatota archaeon]|nr:40S ribosomal protein S19 [Candidatus Thermoplasmatota archaeon]